LLVVAECLLDADGSFVRRYLLCRSTNHLGVACFTVRKKDKNGEWASAQSVDAQKEKSS
jgi:hypothetical protein